MTPRATARLLLGICAAVLLQGCAARARPLVDVPAVTDTIWYVSARARVEGRDTRQLADSLEYGMTIARVTRDGDLFVGALDISFVDSVRLTASAFAAAVGARARAAPGGDSVVVLMVHGFGTSLGEAWNYAAEAHVRSRSPAPWVVFCWPSNGSGVAWPSRDAILTRAYREDSVVAAASLSAFSRAMQAILPSIGGRHLLVVAHSMGAQLVGQSFAGDTVLRRTLARDPLRALAFFAPDVATSHFREWLLPAVKPLARRVVVYASSEDRLLSLSRTINDSERAGLIRDAPAPFTGAEMIDATDGLAAENRVQRVVGTHHTIRRASAALFDLAYVVAGSYAASCRAIMGTAVGGDGFWKLSKLPPPALTRLTSCSRGPPW
jgi:hypothetical protein